MKTISIATVVLIVCTAVSVVQGQTTNRLFWDGGHWKRVQQLAANPTDEYRIKAAYINGVEDGRLYFYLKTWAKQQTFADSLYADPIDYLTPREMIRNIDQFYQDPTHVYVPVVSAMLIANMYAEQIPEEVINAYVDQTRFWINKLVLDMEAEGMYKLLKDKQEKHSGEAVNRQP
ncbi:MAG: hypothetical protein ACE5D2_00045 [Fidelibacterota bacterium]